MVKIQVNSSGKAYVSANNKVLPVPEPVIESLSVTPTTSAQVITAPSSIDGYNPVNVNAVTSSIDNNIVASNIVSGVSILGVNGSATVLNGETRAETLTSSAGNTFTPSSGKNAITSITVTPNNEARSVTPSTSAQTLNVNSGYSGNGTISVGAVTSSIDASIQAENIKKDIQILGVIGTYEGSGGGGSTGKYALLDRVEDDNGNEIGTVSGFFTDANDVEYAVVCLDAQYRLESATWSSTSGTVTNLTEYGMNGAAVDLIANTYTDTATSNCDKILAWCTAGGYTSAAVSHCRSKSFVIGGITYYGQLPNLCELFYICANRAEISNADTSKSRYSSLDIATLASQIWSSSQCTSARAWIIRDNGSVNYYAKTSNYFVAPVLEIPNN